MKSTTGLTLAAVGAILAFAVHGHLSFLNPNAAGWVILLVGVAGLLIPPRAQRRLRQRLIVRDGTGPGYDDADTEYSPALMPAGVLMPEGSEAGAAVTVVEEEIGPE